MATLVTTIDFKKACIYRQTCEPFIGLVPDHFLIRVSPLRTHLPPLTHFQLNFWRLIGLVLRSSVASTPTPTQTTLNVTLKRKAFTTDDFSIFISKHWVKKRSNELFHLRCHPETKLTQKIGYVVAPLIIRDST